MTKNKDLYKRKGNLKPFSKWVGGKRQLLKDIKELVPKKFNNYYEPFVGGGALFFALENSTATINDMNADLISSYNSIKNNVEELIQLLKVHKDNNSKEYYYEIRSFDRNGKIDEMTEVERAARLLYMLSVNFNGLYRVNSKGEFNTPYGRYKNPKIVDEANLRNISEYLRKNNIAIMNGDFELCVKDAKKGDFVYFDPPYVPLTKTSSFTSYTSDGFDYEEQKRLRDLFVELDKKGVYVMLSNSDTPIIHELYKDYKDNINVVYARRMINSNKDGRGKVGEVIITNYGKEV